MSMEININSHTEYGRAYRKLFRRIDLRADAAFALFVINHVPHNSLREIREGVYLVKEWYHG